MGAGEGSGLCAHNSSLCRTRSEKGGGDGRVPGVSSGTGSQVGSGKAAFLPDLEKKQYVHKANKGVKGRRAKQNFRCNLLLTTIVTNTYRTSILRTVPNAGHKSSLKIPQQCVNQWGGNPFINVYVYQIFTLYPSNI